MRRVVITGIGIVSPFGIKNDAVWDKLINGQSGIKNITYFDTEKYPCKIAGQLLQGEEDGAFHAEDFVSKRDQRMMDTFMVYGVAASQLAIEDSGWAPSSDHQYERTGVMVGSGIGGLQSIEETAIDLYEKGPRRISPYFIPSTLINLISGQVSIKYGYKGPNHAVVTACSSGSHAIGDAFRLIQRNDADVMVAGGAEAAICRTGIGGFCALRALATKFNDAPEKASRPWDKDRDGFVMGEGAGVVVLEEYEHAKNRGASIYAEVVGYGMSGDAHHITSPPEDGNGARRSMEDAARDAKINPEQIGYINAHGTSTPVGDQIELRAIKSFLGEQGAKEASISSTKSSVGHLLGAAGGVEAIFTAMALKTGVLPPTLNLDNPDEECQGLDLVPHTAKEKSIEYALSNSFGFGGTNASLILKRV